LTETLSVRNITSIVPSGTTHVVFHLGHHYNNIANGTYNNYHFQQSIATLYQEALRRLVRQRGVRVVIRSMNTVHFKTLTGEYEKSASRSHPNSCVAHIANTTAPSNLEKDATLRELAVNVSASFLDVRGLSDDPLSHPGRRQVDGKSVVDCLHLCQNCGMLRAWNSLLLRYL
jgi:hypothetical protein